MDNLLKLPDLKEKNISGREALLLVVHSFSTEFHIRHDLMND